MLFNYPEKAYVGRKVPKSTFYQNLAPSPVQRELMTQQLERITWLYKLSPSTINVNESDNVPAIQVFQLRRKPEIATVDERLLRSLDKAIPSCLLFEVVQGEIIQPVACYKQKNANGSITTSAYLYGEKQHESAARNSLPVSRHFEHLYEQLIAALLPHPKRTNETLFEAIARCEAIVKLANKVASLEKRVRNKKLQFNKRTEINQQLKQAKAEYNALLTE